MPSKYFRVPYVRQRFHRGCNCVSGENEHIQTRALVKPHNSRGSFSSLILQQMAVSYWHFSATWTHRYIVHPKPPLTGRRAAMQFKIAEGLIITDKKTYARHRRNNILVDIEFYVSDVFDVTVLERYIVSNYRLKDRFPNSLFSCGLKKKKRRGSATLTASTNAWMLLLLVCYVCWI